MQTLGRINVVGALLSVVYGTKEEAGPDLLGEDDFACHEKESNRIVLRRWTKDELSAPRPANGTWTDLMHEVCHAINWENGVTQILKDALPDWTKEARDKLEERIVRAQAPGLVTAFEGLVQLHRAIRRVCR